jgi:hypothetical protein
LFGGTDIYSFPVGSDLPENEFTSYDLLRQLIDKHNVEAARLGLRQVDHALAEIRDALAHGRVSRRQNLIKFSRPTGGRVQVTFNEIMSVSWFTAQKKRVVEAMQIVLRNEA